MSNSNENIFDELKNKVTGDIYTDKIRRYMHSTDGSIFRVEPACIVYPKSTDDVVEIVKFANKYQISIHSRGAGSGLFQLFHLPASHQCQCHHSGFHLTAQFLRSSH